MNLEELYIRNRTIRRFKDQKVSDEDLCKIVDAARIASCANNRQTLRYIIVKSADKVKKLETMIHWAAALKDNKGRPHEGEFPPAYLVIVQKEPRGFSDIDVGIATSMITTTACDLGLGCCIFGSHNPQKVGQFLHLKDTEKARLVIAVGYPAIHSTIVEMKDNQTNYWMDDEENFYVPKRKLKDIIEIQ